MYCEKCPKGSLLVSLQVMPMCLSYIFVGIDGSMCSWVIHSLSVTAHPKQLPKYFLQLFSDVPVKMKKISCTFF